MSSYKNTPLYGGALVCELPANFADVSQIREVPDHQEVWIDKDGFTSIVFDINERIGEKGSSPKIDGEALITHLEEVVGDELDRVKVWNTTPTLFSLLDCAAPASKSHTFTKEDVPRASQDIPAYTLIATMAPRPSPETERRSSPDFTALIMTLVRLEREMTDILITINVPHIKGEYDEADVDLELGKQGKLIGDAVDYAAKIWETFKVKDWGLFSEI